ncbi:MAG TPA: glycine--tRNA ligase subunit beta [Vicinamibacterales bacterium]|nr:glycine--tRNA ligase subunit beta [Vicinamibacterales bacterium]
MDRELLVEIGTEELPASWLPGVTRQLKERTDAKLVEFRLKSDPAETFSTPRRLTVRVARVAERQEDLEEVITGPPVSAAFRDGEPTPAAIGFARKQGAEVGDLMRVSTPKGEYLAYNRRVRGRAAADVLAGVITGILREVSFPKPMRWDAELGDGKGEFPFGRPIRWLLFLYGGRVVPYTIGRTELARGPNVQEIESGALTYGHRFLATSGRPGRSIKVRNFDEYKAKLAEHFVLLDRTERRERITRELDMHARRLGARVMPMGQAELLQEVPDLVEYPSVVAGAFDPKFLELPPEVLTTTMIHHQHFFPVVSDEGKLKPAFLAVTNTEPQDRRTIATNAERVLAARLRDAKFFWDSDRRTNLAARLDRLDTLLFHKQLGSYRAKAERISSLARSIASDVFRKPEHAEFAATAARLAKADLTTDMVFEFPELQGVMGGIYAREEGQPEQIWKAIYYHYLPIAVEPDAPPRRADLLDAAIAWAAVSLADKLDTVVGLFRAGERPTGSRDPFGIRRQMQGVVRTLMDLPELTGLRMEVGLQGLCEAAGRQFGENEDPWGDTSYFGGFVLERTRFALEQRGYPIETVRAVTQHWDVSPFRARRIADALQDVRRSEDFQALAVLFKRVKNIARELDAEPASARALDRARLKEPAEQALLEQLDRVRPAAALAITAGDYRRAFGEIAALRPAVDRFFTEVFVMVEDAALRHARLTLMAELRDLVLQLADISEIAPQPE